MTAAEDYDPAADGYLSWLYAIAVIRSRVPGETRTADEIFAEWKRQRELQG